MFQGIEAASKCVSARSCKILIVLVAAAALNTGATANAVAKGGVVHLFTGQAAFPSETSTPYYPGEQPYYQEEHVWHCWEDVRCSAR
jgi:hypothetical protein